ncbi:hypothetical protein [Anabaena azotica]|uniref:hypothetical protein n=1 Tax=Anabaena azotica TaxID=197653 RepID=UPI0039A4CE2F
MDKGFGNKKDYNNTQNKNSQFYFFLKEALQTSYKNIKNTEKVYKFLAGKLEIINDEFLDWYSVWLSKQLSQPISKEVLILSVKVSLFSEIINQFYLGNKEINLEIAIIGWEMNADFIKSINKSA